VFPFKDDIMYKYLLLLSLSLFPMNPKHDQDRPVARAKKPPRPDEIFISKDKLPNDDKRINCIICTIEREQREPKLSGTS
jgi:hypothetical protein